MPRWAAVLLLLLAVVAVWGLMLKGWRARAARQSDLPQPQELTGQAHYGVPGVYVSTTSHGDWLDRITAHGLGSRSRVVVDCDADGLLVQRDGARSFRIPAADLRGVRRESGMAGKYVERDGLVVVTWQLGERWLDTGVRPDRGDDAARLVGMVQVLTGSSGESSGRELGDDGSGD